MSMTLSFGSRSTKSPAVTNNENKNFIQKIESSRNFSKMYTAEHIPKNDLRAGAISSVVFKNREEAREQAIVYEFWKKIPEEVEPFQYFIAVSKLNKDLLWIRDDENNDLPLSAFKHENNLVDVVPRYSPRL